MDVKRVPTMGWTRGSVAATILLVSQQQRDELAARVREEMEARGWTNSKLAREADLSEKTISRLINGRMDSRYDTLERVSKALGVADLRPERVAPLGLGANGAPGQLDRIEQRLARIEADIAAIAQVISDRALVLATRDIRRIRAQLAEQDPPKAA